MASYDGSKSFPSTPISRKITVAKVIDNLNNEWPQLHLRPRSDLEPPSKRQHNDRELCYDRIAQTFYINRDSLQPSIDAFRLSVQDASASTNLIALLLQCLPSPSRREVASRHTPVSARFTSKIPSAPATPVSSFAAKIRNGPPRGKTPEPDNDDQQVNEPASPSAHRGSSGRPRPMKRPSDGEEQQGSPKGRKLPRVSKVSSDRTTSTDFYTTPSIPNGRAFDSSPPLPVQTSFASTVPQVDGVAELGPNISFETNITAPDLEPDHSNQPNQSSRSDAIFSSMPSLNSDVYRMLDADPDQLNRQSDSTSSLTRNIRNWQAAVQPGNTSPNRLSKSSFGKSTTTTETREAFFKAAETREPLHDIDEAREAMLNISPSQALSQMRIHDGVAGLSAPNPHGPQTQQLPDESPQLRGLATHGFFLPTWNAEGEFKLLWECQRWSAFTGVAADKFFTSVPHYKPNVDDRDEVVSAMKSVLPDGVMAPAVGPRQAWQNAMETGVQYKGRISFVADVSSPMLFRMTLLPLFFDKSCRFQRMYDSHRLFYLDIPDLNKMSEQILGREHLYDRFLDWLCTPKDFLSRTWEAIHLEQSKAKKGDDRFLGYRAVFLAASGPGLVPIEIESVLEEYMGLENVENREQYFRKLFSRIDLGFSRTIPTLVFEPEQIISVDDIYADDTLEVDEYQDPHFDWTQQAHLHGSDGNIMTDGCSTMSVAAMKKIWAALGGDGPLPSAMQGRISGAKGVWARSGPVNSTDERDLDTWIEIRKSQQKFWPPTKPDARSGKHHMTFEVSSIAMARSQESMRGALHTDMIPLLVDRGVPLANIQEIMTKALLKHEESLLEILKDPIETRYWVAAQDNNSEERRRGDDEDEVDQMPISHAGKSKYLLDHGFVPAECPYLLDGLGRLADESLSRAVQRLSVKLDCSFSGLGVADPFGVLEPNTVHLGYSKSFIDALSGEYISSIELPGLITRFPMQLPSDIQKIKIVYDPRLAHLKDCIIFPIRGPVSLPSKLQGGDLDGDRFTLIWNPRLVDAFQNAPVPPTTQSKKDFGVTKDERKLKDVLQGPSPVRNFLREGFRARLKRVPLGMTSNFIKALRTVSARRHKQGHDFSEDAFAKYIDNERDISGLDKKVGKPGFEQAVKRGISANRKTPGIEIFGNHPNDIIYFDHVQQRMSEILRKISDFEKESHTFVDTDLMEMCLEAKGHPSQKVREEHKTLTASLEKVIATWGREFGSKDRRTSKSRIPAIIDGCRGQYLRIRPKDDGLMNPTTINRPRNEPSSFDLLKASTLYSMCNNRKTHAVIFQLAARELAYIKAQSKPNRVVVTDIYQLTKLRKRKVEPIFEVEDDAREDVDDLVLVDSNVPTSGHTGGDESTEDEEFVDSRSYW